MPLPVPRLSANLLPRLSVSHSTVRLTQPDSRGHGVSRGETGLDLVVELFDAYSLSVIGEAHVDNRLFFILYLLLLAAFYACLLRRAIAHARRRHEEGCCFARRIPTGALNGPEVNAVRCFVASDTVRKVLPKTSARTLILSLAVRPRAGTAELLRKSRSRSMDFNS